ncbi:nucleotidyltransferase [Paenibacillus baekrokdamisoli]|uniref:Nucleotidyltransferase n=1 Tax=Paenibacillus baekrokdamisoli TaxID=1712516 RepID=A0A3G9IXF3_9BACL|nr:aminoglycoside adenylyltransferase domain-containing protein [Paenibacillus baekrokdamisoli]MBB3068755.1 putative nucleotidyltransferase [Paenibacillus baekrokdamisoli]BBH23587.1 nucleotidyltransferase [Paenibacillus baekrokdamisoli]
MNARIPTEIQPLISDFKDLLQSKLPNAVLGFYLQGSIALRGFNKKRSDIDFLIVVNHELTAGELSIIRDIHEELKQKHEYYMVMEGQYTTLGHLDKTIKKPQELYPNYFYGEYMGLRNGWIDPTSLWITKYHGISVLGPDVNEINIQVDWDDLLLAMKYNLHSYWTDKVKDYTIFLQDDWVVDTVLTLGRILYTLQNKEMITKEQGGYYLLAVMTNEWHSLINEALRIREGSELEMGFESIEERALHTLRFVLHIIDLCNEKYQLRTT